MPSALGKPKPPRIDKNSRIAVLGAGGFLGSHLVAELRTRFGCPIVAVDVDLDKLSNEDPGVERRIARLDQPGLLPSLVDACDVLVSLTAICTPARYNTDPLEVIDASYTDLVPLVKLCAERQRWLLHLSTCEVYGRAARRATDGEATTSMNEEDTALWLGPVHKERWSYACAKQLLERVIFAHGQHGDLPFTIVRPFNVIGPRMDFVEGIDGEGMPRVLAAFMGALMKRQDLLLVDGGHQRRSFVYVSDFVDGLGRVLERPDQAVGQIFNLGAPENDRTIAELAQALIDEFRRHVPDAKPRVRSVSAESVYGAGYDDSQVRIPDIEKARMRLGWQPVTGFADMLPPIVDDYLKRYGERINALAVKRAKKGQAA